KGRIDEAITNLSVQLTHSVEQSRNMEKLRHSIDTRIQILDRNLNYKRVNNPVSAEQLLEGKKYMDEIRNMVSIMQSAEQNVLASRTESMNKFASYTPILIIFSAILAITITLVFFRRVNQDFLEKTNLTSELEEKNLETENRLKAIEKVTSQISNGDYDILSDENAQQNLGNVAKPLNRMAASLKDSFNTRETKEWLSSSVATLNDRMMGDKTIENLASAVLETITEITGSSVAALYLQQDNFLHLSG